MTDSRRGRESRQSPFMFFAFALSALVVAQPAGAQVGKVKVIKSTKAARPVDAKTQAELDAAEARAEDTKLRCAEDPDACSGKATEAKANDAANKAREEALARKEAELAEREEALRKKQEEEKEEKEKVRRAQAEQKQQVEKQTKQVEQVMQGLTGAMSGEE